MKIFDALLWGLIILFGLISLIALIDLVTALDAQACGTRGSGPNCYPWGTEGPAAGDWRFASKEAYLGSGIVVVILTLVAAGVMVWSHAKRSNAARVLVGVLLMTLALVSWL